MLSVSGNTTFSISAAHIKSHFRVRSALLSIVSMKGSFFPNTEINFSYQRKKNNATKVETEWLCSGILQTNLSKRILYWDAHPLLFQVF